MEEGRLYYTLEDIGLEDDDLSLLSAAAGMELMFDAIDYYKDVQIHVNSDTNLMGLCPETRGIFILRKVDEAVALVQFIGRTTGKIYTGSFVKNPLHFYGWFEPISMTEENANDTDIESRVEVLEDAVGDITLVDHYGKDIVQILNKYTRQVLLDTSEDANQILLENYYGNIQDITYDTPLIIQVNNDSVAWTAGVDDHPAITFYKEVEGEDPIEETYKLLKLDLAGGPTSYAAIDENSLTKNVFYTVIKREAELTPGIVEEIFVLLQASESAEYGTVSNRLDDLETRFDGDNLITIADIIAAGDISGNTITSTSTISAGTNLFAGGTLSVTGNTTLLGTLDVTGATTVGALAVGTSINLSNCSVSIKANPGVGDLVNKAYVDTRDTATITTVMAKFAVGTAAPPASGTPGTFYIQYTA